MTEPKSIDPKFTAASGGIVDSGQVGTTTTLIVDNGGLRFDEGKLQYDLLPPDAIEEIVRVYTRGAKKYARRNWERGMNFSKCLNPLERHLAEWKMGHDSDDETQLKHMAHVAWNAIALLTYQLRKIGVDDRVFKDGKFIGINDDGTK